jgi:signal transduction histidine kinase
MTARAARLGGHIDLTSAPDVGTLVEISLPIR